MDYKKSVYEMWKNYLKSVGKETSDKNFEAWHFEATEEGANKLAELVLSGKKRATAGLVCAYDYDNDPYPKVGDLNIITDWYGEAKCVIKTTNVKTLKFNEITEELAAKEGEGDLSLDYWKKKHEKFFKMDCEEIGEEFTEDIPFFFIEFEIVYK